MENQIKNHIEIEGVILTPECIEQIKSLQEHGNESLNHNTNMLADTVCLLSAMIDYSNEEQKKQIIQNIKGLSIFRTWVKNLARP